MLNFKVHSSLPLYGQRKTFNECLEAPLIQHFCGEKKSFMAYPVLSRYY
jgi:hypothetical protein